MADDPARLVINRSWGGTALKNILIGMVVAVVLILLADQWMPIFQQNVCQ